MAQQKILVVDDQPEILNTLKRLFSESYQVLTAPGGKEGLIILKNEKPAVILADQRMPEMTGTQFLEKSIALPPNSVRMLITAYADIDACISAINKGKIYQYISKPWEPEELIQTVRRAVEHFRLAEENKKLTKELASANEQLKRENVILRQNIETKYNFQI